MIKSTSIAQFVALVGLAMACSEANPNEEPGVDAASSQPTAADDAPLAPVSQPSQADDVSAERAELAGEGGSDGSPDAPIVDDATVVGAGGALGEDVSRKRGSVEEESGATELAGGAGGAGTDTEAEEVRPEPSCGELPDGPYCGAKLASPGDLKTVYRCEAGQVTATSECAGGCLDNACFTFAGPTDGLSDETRELCIGCLLNLCETQARQCDNTGKCAPLEECRDASCSGICAI